MFYDDYTHYRYICKIRIGLGVGSFPRTPARARLLSFTLHTIPSMLRLYPMPWIQRRGEREAYFKTDLFYAFIRKANLFSNVRCLNGIGQQREETGVAASRSGLHPAPLPQLLLPPTARSVEGWSPEPRPEHLPRAGRALGSPGRRMWLRCPLLVTLWGSRV